MPTFLRSIILIALCLVTGSLPGRAATVAPENAPAEQSPVSRRPNIQQICPTEDSVAQPDAQKNSAGIPRPEPAPQPDAPGSALPETEPPTTRQNAAICRALPPLREMVTSPFGNRRMPGWLSRRGMAMRFHAGIDIRARQGWPITAFKSGTVIRAGENGPLGISVDIRQDDGMTARYGHMAKTLVKIGQRVERGLPIGRVGCTGRTTGAHLHFGLLNASGKAVDPMPYLHSADEVLRPNPAEIPPVIEAQSCGPVLRGPNGRPARLGSILKKLDEYTPPPIPTWGEGH